jgi:hypothetical protein
LVKQYQPVIPQEDIVTPNGPISPFGGIRAIRETTTPIIFTAVTKGPFLWITNHIILGENQHFHLVNTGRATSAAYTTQTTPDLFNLIDGNTVLTYKRSPQAHMIDAAHFKWKILHDFSNIGKLSLLVINNDHEIQ